jgi:hypothetical protein
VFIQGLTRLEANETNGYSRLDYIGTKQTRVDV